MQHLLDALQAASKSGSYLSQLPKDIQLVEQYLRTGDERLIHALLSISDQRIWPLNNSLPEALPTSDRWAPEDRRVVRLAIMRSPALMPQPGQTTNSWDAGGRLLTSAIARVLEKEAPTEDAYALFREEFSALQIDSSRVAAFTAQFAGPLAREGKLTSAGRFLVALPPKTMVKEMEGLRTNYSRDEFLTAWVNQHPDHAIAVAEELVKAGHADFMVHGGWVKILDQCPAEREQLCALAFSKLEDAVVRFELGCRLTQLFPSKYDDATWSAAPAALDATGGDQTAVARWMLQQRGVEAVPALRDFIVNWDPGYVTHVVQNCKIAVQSEAVNALGSAARPVILAGLQEAMPVLRRASISVLISLHESVDDEQIAALLEVELTSSDNEGVIAAVPIAMSWDGMRVAPRLWELLSHKSKPVREAVVNGLVTLGEKAADKATELLSARKSETRIAAATLLGRLGSPAAVEALRRAFDGEKSDVVADAIRAALTAAGASAAASSESTSTPEVSRAAVEAAIRKAAAKAKTPATWLDPEKLPALQFADGSALGADAVRYLLFRQSRCKTIEPDAEARPLYALIDRATSGDFALAVLNGFFGSGADAGDRWALAIAGLLGDERVVPLLSRQIEEWADSARGKLAEYAVHALALQASDPALLAVDALAIRYRTKYKNIGKAAADAFGRAAEARGLSPAELGDRVVPWLGFVAGQPRLISWGETQVEVSIGLDFKPAYRDVAKNKRVASLPASVPAEIKAEMKDLSASLKEAVKAQHLRFENLMVQQHHWPVARWAELFLHHPLLMPFAVRLVWGAYDDAGRLGQTFRALEDRTLTTAGDEPASTPSSGSVGIVHPLELDGATRQAWLQHLADYDIAPPFSQLERPVITPPADQVARKIFKDFESIELNAMTFRGRAEKRGWVRGSVVDAGGVPYYYKPFPAAGVDVFLSLDGMYVGIDMYSSITLGSFYFVRHGSVQIGSYTYDEPANESDTRFVPAGEVPPIAYSEALGDLGQIAGKGVPTEA